MCTYFWRCPAVLGPSPFFFLSSNLSCMLYTRSSCHLAGGKLFFYWLSSVHCVLRLQTKLDVRTFLDLQKERKCEWIKLSILLSGTELPWKLGFLNYVYTVWKKSLEHLKGSNKLLVNEDLLPNLRKRNVCKSAVCSK